MTDAQWAAIFEPATSGRIGERAEVELGAFPVASVVQLVAGTADQPDAVVSTLHPAKVTVTDRRVVAVDGVLDWSWLLDDLEAVIHGVDAPWTILVVPGIADFGVEVRVEDVAEFRSLLPRRGRLQVRHEHPSGTKSSAPWPAPLMIDAAEPAPTVEQPTVEHRQGSVQVRERQTDASGAAQTSSPSLLAGLAARNISAWFGSHQVLDRVSLEMAAGQVTALIGPSGCGKSTFLRILNRMHEMIASAAMAGEVMLDGHDIYDPARKLTDARREIGMVFQKPNPFPAMSIYDNVVASLRVTGVKATTDVKDDLVESCLTKAGLWTEVRDRLRQPGGGLSGGQQQRLCIARALAIRPRVLLMDEPCSALDPTSTRRIEQTVMELVSEVTIVIVTHNMQQAARVSDRCAFFLAEQGTPGVIVEHGPTAAMFGAPQDSRTEDYVNGRFG